jgi:hypothetical protein
LVIWAVPDSVPLLVIPGSFQSTGSMRQWVAAFVASRPVIVFDQQGHGRTADTPRAMSYEQFGHDAAALLRALAVERADVMGIHRGEESRCSWLCGTRSSSSSRRPHTSRSLQPCRSSSR